MKYFRYVFLFAMVFIQSCSAAVEATPTLELPSPVPLTPTAEILEPTSTPTFELPVDFKQYQDPVVGVSVFIPESWVVTSVIPGQYASLQSYTEDKYIGGEPFQPGDTKCDLSFRPIDVTVASYIQEQKTSSISTILSEGEIALLSGQSGIRLEAEGRGTSLSLVTEINQRTVVLICHGELMPFDEIAVTLAEIPSWISLLTIEPSPGFKPYLDEMAGIAVLVPNRWVWNQVIPGQSAILQSYPEGKYIGGEAFQPLDMKCDFTIHPPSTVLNSQLQIIKSDTSVTIVSESQVKLLSGENGIRLELDSMGRSLLIISEVNARVVTLSCFGDLTGFDEIAVTLHSVD